MQQLLHRMAVHMVYRHDIPCEPTDSLRRQGNVMFKDLYLECSNAYCSMLGLSNMLLGWVGGGGTYSYLYIYTMVYMYIDSSMSL